MTREEETLHAARLRMTASLAERRRKLSELDEERAARVLADLWAVLETHGATDDMLRGCVDLPSLAVSVVDAVDRQARALDALAGRITADELLASPREVALMKEEEEMHNAPGSGSSCGNGSSSGSGSSCGGTGHASVMSDGMTTGLTITDPVNGSILETSDRV